MGSVPGFRRQTTEEALRLLGKVVAKNTPN